MNLTLYSSQVLVDLEHHYRYLSYVRRNYTKSVGRNPSSSASSYAFARVDDEGQATSSLSGAVRFGRNCTEVQSASGTASHTDAYDGLASSSSFIRAGGPDEGVQGHVSISSETP
jgi:hypothetical protein